MSTLRELKAQWHKDQLAVVLTLPYQGEPTLRTGRVVGLGRLKLHVRLGDHGSRLLFNYDGTSSDSNFFTETLLLFSSVAAAHKWLWRKRCWAELASGVRCLASEACPPLLSDDTLQLLAKALNCTLPDPAVNSPALVSR